MGTGQIQRPGSTVLCEPQHFKDIPANTRPDFRSQRELLGIKSAMYGELEKRMKTLRSERKAEQEVTTLF